MKIEVIDFYPLERNEEKEYLTGTLRIKLPDIGIHLLGIFVSKNKKYWHFSLPGRIGTRHDTGEDVRYPFIVFEDKEKQKELMTAIREQGSAFIENKLLDKENPLIFPEKKNKQEPNKKPKQAVAEQMSDNAPALAVVSSDAHQKPAIKEAAIHANANPAPKETIGKMKPQAVQSISSKQWMDPPKRKDLAHKKGR